MYLGDRPDSMARASLLKSFFFWTWPPWADPTSDPFPSSSSGTPMGLGLPVIAELFPDFSPRQSH